MKSSAKQYLDECLTAYPVLESFQEDIIRAFEILVACFKKNGKVLICGNGGSAADADHIVGELMNKFSLKRPLAKQDSEKIKASAITLNDKQFLLSHLQRQLPAISLSAHSPLVTAIANDEDSEMIFGQQVLGYGREGDVLIALTTSGNSKNVIRAICVAKIFGLKIICLTGKSGGRVKDLGCDVLIRVPEEVTYKVQQLHQPVYHCLCGMVEGEIFG
ncbi:MAG TPA: SIS domain-containing protein [Chitinivibrionales bacterium]|nr:SIS domain-containing protein [Chitinivibrionales bacterium]